MQRSRRIVLLARGRKSMKHTVLILCGAFALVLGFPILAHGQAVVAYACTDCPQVISPTALSVITVPTTACQDGFQDQITDLNVTLNITHPINVDLGEGALTAPNASMRDLFATVGGANIHVTLDDEAATDIATGCAGIPGPCAGTFRPEPPANLSTNIDGTDPSGNWTLRITDEVGSAVGQLNNWSLVLTCAAAPPPPPPPPPPPAMAPSLSAWGLLALGGLLGGLLVWPRAHVR